MEFLLAAPIPPRAVFVTKLVQAVLPNFLFMCLFNLPALIGLGIAQGYNIVYFVMVPVTLVLLMLAGAGLAALGVMLVVRLVPARRVAEVLGLVGGVTSILCSQSNPDHARHRAGPYFVGTSDRDGKHRRAVQPALLAAGVAGSSARRIRRRAMVDRAPVSRRDRNADAGGVCRVARGLGALVHLRLGQDTGGRGSPSSGARGAAAQAGYDTVFARAGQRAGRQRLEVAHP
jgi:hypothetical protein